MRLRPLRPHDYILPARSPTPNGWPLQERMTGITHSARCVIVRVDSGSDVAPLQPYCQ
jgi:hypothetical protein